MSLIPETGYPPIAVWLAERGKDQWWAGPHFGCSPEYVRQMCLPLNDLKRRVPSDKLKRRIDLVTRGGVTPFDWPKIMIEQDAAA